MSRPYLFSYFDPDLDPNPAPHEEEVVSIKDCISVVGHLSVTVLQCYSVGQYYSVGHLSVTPPRAASH